MTCHGLLSVIENCVLQGNKQGTEIGAKRILNNVFFETLLEWDEATHTIHYSIDDGPTPVSKSEVHNYLGQLHLLPVTKDNSTLVEWSSSWESETDNAIAFCHGIYVALLDELAKSFKT